MKSILMLSLGLTLMSNAFGANVDRVIRRAQNVVTLLERRSDSLSQRQIDEVAQKVEEITQIISGRVPTPNPPTYGQVIYEAECWIDDDPDFDYNQRQAGMVRGSVGQMIDECRFRAESTYQNSSAGILRLNPLSDTTHMDTFECHIDDDPDFDFNQIVIGKLYSLSSREATADCAAIAQMAYGSKGSSGIQY